MCEKKPDRPVQNILTLEDEDNVRPVRNIFTLEDDETDAAEDPKDGDEDYLERYADEGEEYVPVRPQKLLFSKEQVMEILKRKNPLEWKVVNRAGSGSFAVTYSVDVIQMEIPASYILKVIDLTGLVESKMPEDLDTETYEKIREKWEKQYLERERNEVAFMRAFQDVPQIVNLVESWEDNMADKNGVEHRLFCILMDRWDGDLTDFMGKEGSQAEGLQLSTDLMKALLEMNRKPRGDACVMHRDVRCENVLYRSAENACGYRFALADFGIAKLKESSDKRTNSITPRVWDYLPESGRNYSWKSEVYLAGMTIYRFMSGWGDEQMENAFFQASTPFFDENGFITLPCPASVKDTRFWNLLKRMLQRDPDKRPTLGTALNILQKLKKEDRKMRERKKIIQVSVSIFTVVAAIFTLLFLFDVIGNEKEIPSTGDMGLTEEENETQEQSDTESPAKNEVAEAVMTGSSTGESDDVWNDIEVSMRIGNYDGVLEKAEQNHLLETEEMLNLQGIMFANGLGNDGDGDLDQAIQYFQAACIRKKSAESFRNLLLASLSADLAEITEENGETAWMEHTAEAFRFGESNEIPESEKLLWERIYLSDVTVPDGENLYDYFWSLENWPQILREGVFELSPYRYLVASNYDYIVSKNEDGEAEIEAIVTQIVEKELPIHIMRGTYPDTYVTFYGDTIEQVPLNAIDVAVFDYPSTYIDENGNEQYWKDTEEFYYGEIPPEDTEDTRWMINGYDENGGRKFRKQIK